jgi:5-methylcytosine-specific restriction endonuclease McrA
MATLPKIKTIRNKCDKLLTPIIKAMHPNCLLHGGSCAGVTQVGHHHIKKSQSSALRYDLDNIIPLCTSCHMMLHQNESKWVTILIEKKGMEWALNLLKKNVIIKTDIHFYIKNYERLKEIHDELV